MADLVNYVVARGHQGDLITDDGTKVHYFAEGEPRLADPDIVKHLVDNGVLVLPHGDEERESPVKEEPARANKAEPKPATKVESKVATKAEPKPANKAEPKTATKAGGAQK